MEKVVYFLGAGFSAPLGLPLMNNFYTKSMEQYFKNPEKYSYFTEVFTEFQRLSVSKNYYEADLFNIEEILSILEMQSFLGKSSKKELFNEYIINVIEYYTQPLNWREKDFPKNWHIHFLGPNQIIRGFCTFAFNLFGLCINEKTNERNIHSSRMFYAERIEGRKTYYGVISLNYDLLFENILEKFFNYDKIKFPEHIAFNKDKLPGDWSSIPFYKLHGCVKTRTIIPPTWAKGGNESIKPIWQNALELLSDADHLRMIGYSLPDSDNYIKYLFKAAIIEREFPKLKSIDVICLDDDKGITQNRYRSFFKYNKFRFKNARTEDYFNFIVEKHKPNSEIQLVNFDKLEEAHSDFMESKKEFND